MLRSIRPFELSVLAVSDGECLCWSTVVGIESVGHTEHSGRNVTYLRVSSEHHDGARAGIMFVLRVVFKTPENPDEIPMAVFHWEKEYRRQFPLFPIVTHCDVPLFLFPLGGYGSGGGMPNPLEHVEFYRKHGVIREQPLRPPDNPLRVLDELVASPEWVFEREAKFGYSEHHLARLIAAEQLLALVESVCRVETNERGRRIGYRDDFGPRWREIREAFVELDARWDEQQQQYVFADGTTLPPRHVVMYRREIWEIGDLDGEVVRTSPVFQPQQVIPSP